jgi:hypothetical protein
MPTKYRRLIFQKTFRANRRRIAIRLETSYSRSYRSRTTKFSNCKIALSHQVPVEDQRKQNFSCSRPNLVSIWLPDPRSPSSWLQSPARRSRANSLLRSSTALFPKILSVKILRRTQIWRNRPVLLTRTRNLLKVKTFYYRQFYKQPAPVLRQRSRALILARLDSCSRASKSLSKSHLWSHFLFREERSRIAFTPR